MSLLSILGGEKIQNAALGFLKEHMLKNGVTMAAISVKPQTAELSGKGVDNFEMKFYNEPVVVISVKDLEKYQDAVNKCIINGL
jgi:hypothetical protein